MFYVRIWYMCAECGAYSMETIYGKTLGDALSKSVVFRSTAQFCVWCVIRHDMEGRQ